MIVTITNQKGGVAKTTTAVSIAHGLAGRIQQDVLLVDLDQQGHVATSLGLRAESCLFDFTVARQPLINCIRLARPGGPFILPGDARTKHVDLIYRNETNGFAQICEILHCNGGAGFGAIVFDTPAEGLLQEAAIAIADLVVVPARCEALSIAGVHDTLALCQRVNPAVRIVILPAMLDHRVNEHAYNVGLLDQLAGATGGRVLVSAPIPARIAVAEAHAFGQTIWEYKRSGIDDVRAAYTALLNTIAPETAASHAW